MRYLSKKKKGIWHFLLWEKLSTQTLSRYIQSSLDMHDMLPLLLLTLLYFYLIWAFSFACAHESGVYLRTSLASFFPSLHPWRCIQLVHRKRRMSLLWYHCLESCAGRIHILLFFPLLRNWWTGPSESTFPSALECLVHLHPFELGRLSLKLQV